MFLVRYEELRIENCYLCISGWEEVMADSRIGRDMTFQTFEEGNFSLGLDRVGVFGMRVGR